MRSAENDKRLVRRLFLGNALRQCGVGVGVGAAGGAGAGVRRGNGADRFRIRLGNGVEPLIKLRPQRDGIIGVIQRPAVGMGQNVEGPPFANARVADGGEGIVLQKPGVAERRFQTGGRFACFEFTCQAG